MANPDSKRLVDLSHVIEHGMVTYKGLPAPHICDYWTREHSAAFYDDGSTFQIGRIDMVANTGTYLDSPFHRFADGQDLAALDLGRLAGLPGIVVRSDEMAVDARAFEGRDLSGKAVLVNTGWDRHWRADAYYHDHPFLTRDAARLLVESGAAPAFDAGREGRGVGMAEKDDVKRYALEWVDRNEGRLSEFCAEIWRYAEPAWREYRSARAY